MFTEAWRLERDYFYDRGMHGVDWPAMRAKYQPLVDRVTDRAELSDILAQMVAELSALHIFVRGGDLRDAGDDAWPASLGALFARDEKAGGYRVDHIIATDPDRPERRVPLAQPGVDVDGGRRHRERQRRGGAVGAGPGGAAARPGRQAGAAAREAARRAAAARDVIVVPITAQAEDDLRYDEWEYTRRLAVEKAGQDQIGYVHLRAMGGGNMAEWMREFYPVFDRAGSHHRRAPQQRRQHRQLDPGPPAAQGLVLLAAARRPALLEHAVRLPRPHGRARATSAPASDGEAFAEGFRRLGLGKVIGHADVGRRSLAQLAATSSSTAASRRPPRPASTGRKASGSSKATASIPTSSSTTCRTRRSAARTRNWTRRCSTCRN